MPIYPCKCKSCGHYEEVFLTVAEHKNLPDHCGQQMSRVFTAPHVIEDMKPYISPIDGKPVKNRAAHRDHMKRHGVIEVGNEKITNQRSRPKDKPDESLKQDLYDSITHLEQRGSP